jgi:alpha-beta hydrolase superfamily lysophospholipase
MKSRACLAVLLFVLVVAGPGTGQASVRGTDLVPIRGKQVSVYSFPAPGEAVFPRGKVLFVPGDLGMHGFAVTIAETVASWGYDVYGLDTRQYLESFTGKVPLQASDVMGDFRQLAQWARGASHQRLALVGWSEGAGLCLLAAADDSNKDLFSGLTVFGLTESNLLGWRWSDLFSALCGKEAKEPSFFSQDYLARVAPLPLLVIQSTGDQYVSVSTQKRMFAGAQEPKRLVMIEAKNHRFEGNQQELLRNIREGLKWMSQATR